MEILEQHNLIGAHEAELEALQSAMISEFDSSFAGSPPDWTICHGDLWSGNILVRARQGAQDAGMDMYMIDRKFAQYGHRCMDLGQILGDLHERWLVRHVQNATSILQGLIHGYGPVSEDVASRTAIYIGVHIINQDERRTSTPFRDASADTVMNVMKVGLQFVLKGLERDYSFFADSCLQSLFESKSPHVSYITTEIKL